MKLAARKAHLQMVLRDFQHVGQPHVTALTLHSVVHQGVPMESVYCNGCRASRMLPEEEQGKWAEAFNQLYCDLRLMRARVTDPGCLDGMGPLFRNVAA